jgi:hypothetical protein
MSGKFLGFVVAPTAAAMVGALFFGLRNESVEVGTTAFMFLALSGYIGTLLIAFPAFHFFERWHWVTLPALALLGIGSAFLLTLMVALILPAGRGVSWSQGFVNLCSVSLPVGLLAGVCFWFIVRPRDAKS